MKFCKLITEVDLELLEWLLNNGYPIDRIEENGQVYYKTPAMLCQNMKVNDEVTNYSNGLIHMDIENVRRKRGLYKTGDLLIDMDSNIIQKGLEKIMVSKAAFTSFTVSNVYGLLFSNSSKHFISPLASCIVTTLFF